MNTIRFWCQASIGYAAILTCPRKAWAILRLNLWTWYRWYPLLDMYLCYEVSWGRYSPTLGKQLENLGCMQNCKYFKIIFMLDNVLNILIHSIFDGDTMDRSVDRVLWRCPHCGPGAEWGEGVTREEGRPRGVQRGDWGFRRLEELSS